MSCTLFPLRGSPSQGEWFFNEAASIVNSHQSINEKTSSPKNNSIKGRIVYFKYTHASAKQPKVGSIIIRTSKKRC
jgi:hypothetical protein